VGEWNLLKPITIGSQIVRNRIAMAPMCTRLAAADGSVTQRLIDYYAERARNRIGMVMVEYSYIDSKASRAGICQLGAYSDHMIPGLNELAEAITQHGVRAILQICHAGRQTSHAITNTQPLAPSAIPSKKNRVAGVEIRAGDPREISLAEVQEIQQSFVDAAVRAKRAGFDGVEIHGAHGYLLCQFLSPYTNQRTDRYGGTLERRAAFALETIDKLRMRVGPDFVIGYRLSAEEFVQGGINIDTSKEFARMVERKGVDYLHVSAGIVETVNHISPSTYLQRDYRLHLSKAIKDCTRTPVAASGSLDAHTGETALRNQCADFVTLGRALIADPQLPEKLYEQRVEDIRPCIRGNEGCVSRTWPGRSLRCEVNPAAGREKLYTPTPAARRKKVLVIGGGVAGMEAARVAANRGHNVVLIEKNDRLGGHLIAGSAARFKKDTGQLLRWLTKQLKDAQIQVLTERDNIPALMKDIRPDVTVVAVGSEYIRPAVPGASMAHAVTASQVLQGEVGIGDEVCVVGGGFLGCETALFISEEMGKQVTVIEKLDELLLGMEPSSAMSLVERMRNSSVVVRTGLCLEEICEGKVACIDKERNRHEISADSVVLAIGLAPRKELVERIRELIPEVFTIGDCAEGGHIYHAFEDAWRVNLSL